MYAPIAPTPGGYVRHRSCQWLGVIQPDGAGRWGTDGEVRIHWLGRQAPDGWYELAVMKVVS